MKLTKENFDAIPNHSDWVNEISKSAFNIVGREYPQDESLHSLQDLLNQGYNQVLWHAENSHCSKCQPLNGQTWTLSDFLSGLSHNAPIFEHSHVGDRSCYITISGPELQEILVGPYPYA